jgi:hypothetical protein
MWKDISGGYVEPNVMDSRKVVCLAAAEPTEIGDGASTHETLTHTD